MVRFRAFFERSPVAMAMLRADGVLDASNDALARLLGRSVKELASRAFEELATDEGREERRAELRALFESSISFDRPVTLVRGDGSRLLARMRATPAYDHGPSTVAYVVLERAVDAQPASLELAVLDGISDGFVSFDRDWRFVVVNHAAEEYLQRPRSELLGKNLWELYPHAIHDRIGEEYRRAAASPTPTEFELVAPLRQRRMAFKAFPTARGVSFYFHDVTEQRRVEEALRFSEAQFRSLFENALDGVFLTSPTGEIHAVNPAGCAMLGRSEADIVRGGRSSVVDATDPRLAALLDARRRTGRAHGHVRMLRGDGTPFEADVTSVVFRDATGAERTSMMVRDLSDARRAEERLRFVADATAALGESLDVDDTIHAITDLLVPRFGDLCFVDLAREEGGFTRAAVAHRDGKRAAEIEVMRRSPPRADSAEGPARAFREQRAIQVDAMSDDFLRAMAVSPEHLEAWRALAPTSALIVPMLLGGRCVGMLSLYFFGDGRKHDPADVTLVAVLAHRAAVALSHARVHEIAVRARRTRDDVLAIVSHDLRAPLNVINLHASLLARKEPSAETTAIMRAVSRADRLIQDLLIVARLESGTLPLELARESVAPIVRDAIELHDASARQKGITLEAEVEPAIPELPLDRHRVFQVLSNLIGNAIKFTPEGGRISLRARREPGHVVLEVADDGPGMAPEEAAHVFERYWQAAHTRKAGSGLGLAIAKGIVEQHGGEIRVETAPGSGSTFVVSLPAPVE